ncbi:MAG TPA: 50S ribosomal protein L15 [Candidatus Saccharimonadales bacterium]|nr:50S ribosomal protein L15 [Candidatus Saccharimonadales bacterium]
MKVHELNLVANKDRKRVGRGIAAGGGKTAGRGTKGQNARTGKKLRAGFEGGQLPLMKRIPKKRGFRSIRVPAQVVYTFQLDALKGKEATNESLAEAGLVATPYHSIKIVLKGELKKAGAVKVQAASKGAIEAITAAGGSFAKTDTSRKPSTKKAKEA